MFYISELFYIDTNVYQQHSHASFYHN